MNNAKALQIESIQAVKILKYRLSELCDFVHRNRNQATPDQEQDYFWMIGTTSLMIDMLEKLSRNIDPDCEKILLDAIPDAHRLAESIRQDLHGNLSMLSQ